MELYEREYPARVSRWGSQEFDLAAGKSLKIETIPAGEEILNEEVPAGKKWTVTCRVDITEEDV